MRKRELFGPFEWPARPTGPETAGTTVERKAHARYQAEIIINNLFSALVSHLGRPEAVQLLKRYVERFARRGELKRYVERFVGRGESRPRNPARDDFLLEVLERVTAISSDPASAPGKAAEWIWKEKGSTYGNSRDAIEKHIRRLVVKRSTGACKLRPGRKRRPHKIPAKSKDK